MIGICLLFLIVKIGAPFDLRVIACFRFSSRARKPTRTFLLTNFNLQ